MDPDGLTPELASANAAALRGKAEEQGEMKPEGMSVDNLIHRLRVCGIEGTNPGIP